MTQESLKLHGKMSAVLEKADGTVEHFSKDNMIVDVGFDFIADAIGKASGRPDAMRGIALGTGTQTVQASDTALHNLVFYKEATYSHAAKTKTFTFTARFEHGEGTGALTEAAVATARGGIILDRVNFAVINKGADDTLTVTFTFTLS